MTSLKTAQNIILLEFNLSFILDNILNQKVASDPSIVVTALLVLQPNTKTRQQW
jgi:hypothetical protein